MERWVGAVQSVERCVGTVECGAVCWDRTVWGGVLGSYSVERCVGTVQKGSGQRFNP
jgi:hypothetical protein